MNRLVGIRGQDQDPASSPGYVLPMASFEQAISRGEKEKNEITRKQWADMALRSLHKFMDSQKNEAIIDKMVEYQKHYEALAALDKTPQGGKAKLLLMVNKCTCNMLRNHQLLGPRRDLLGPFMVLLGPLFGSFKPGLLAVVSRIFGVTSTV
ncbi:hypothetical protein IL306_008964 [Fusarium sp. DS 682]|nr:hypothetical protein IL306_008964 [Fusarium sp. DS 682]